jgi:hypothetical protein
MRLRVLTFLCFLFHAVSAQHDEVIIAPPQLIEQPDHLTTTVLAFYPGFWAPGFKLEKATPNKYLSMGIHARGYIFLFNGGRAEPFIRYYFRKKAPEGLFFQTKISAAAYDANSFLFGGLYCYESSNGMLICPGDPGYIKQIQWRYFFGTGFATGYQFLLGKHKRFALDLFGGMQIIFPSHSLRHPENRILWMMRAFPLEMGIRMGWAF